MQYNARECLTILEFFHNCITSFRHTDPISTPQAFISSLQLRDLILQEEHSMSMWNMLGTIAIRYYGHTMSDKMLDRSDNPNSILVQLSDTFNDWPKSVHL